MSRGLPDEFVDQVRQENDIVDVISEYVQLKKQGRNYFGLCPFHEEKSPSFSVVKDKQFFYCFGCRKTGNVFNFLMELESLSFIEAVTHLAERVQITVPENVSSEKNTSLSTEEETVLSAYDWLTKFYHHLIKYSEEGQNALAYLKDRGINDETIQQFQLGFSPSNSVFTTEFLEEKGFHLQTLVKNGLLSSNEQGSFYDIFRNRVIFPIRNHLGKTIAFGGRALYNDEPKYLNSREHTLFQKGNVFFNYDLAKNHIRKENTVIIFEGYMDVLQAYQSGIRNVVATLGTALSESQVHMMSRFVDNVILCYDSDDAGLNAAYEAGLMFQKQGKNVKIATMKDNLDPDDYIRQFGGDIFRSDVLEASDTFIKFYMKYRRNAYNLSNDAERIAYVEEMTKVLAKIESPIEREYYVKELADEFQLSTEILHFDIQSHEQKNRPHKNKQLTSMRYQQPIRTNMLKAHIQAERYLIALMFRHPFVVSKVQQELGIHFTVEAHKVILTFLYGIFEEYGEVHVSELYDKIEDEHIKQIVTEIAMLEINNDVTDEELNDYIESIRSELDSGTYLRQLIQKQKEEKDPILAAKIGLEIIELQKQLKM